jgi:hypothetical protein
MQFARTVLPVLLVDSYSEALMTVATTASSSLPDYRSS